VQDCPKMKRTCCSMSDYRQSSTITFLNQSRALNDTCDTLSCTFNSKVSSLSSQSLKPEWKVKLLTAPGRRSIRCVKTTYSWSSRRGTPCTVRWGASRSKLGTRGSMQQGISNPLICLQSLRLYSSYPPKEFAKNRRPPMPGIHLSPMHRIPNYRLDLNTTTPTAKCRLTQTARWTGLAHAFRYQYSRLGPGILAEPPWWRRWPNFWRSLAKLGTCSPLYPCGKEEMHRYLIPNHRPAFYGTKADQPFGGAAPSKSHCLCAGLKGCQGLFWCVQLTSPSAWICV